MGIKVTILQINVSQIASNGDNGNALIAKESTNRVSYFDKSTWLATSSPFLVQYKQPKSNFNIALKPRASF